MLLVTVKDWAVMGSVLCAVNKQRPAGAVATSAWPKEFTEQFAGYIYLDAGVPKLQQEGIEQLRQHNLWFQLLDENGAERLTCETADARQTGYSAADLLRVSQDDPDRPAFVYGLWLTRQTSRITKSLREIAARAYLPLLENGAYCVPI